MKYSKIENEHEEKKKKGKQDRRNEEGTRARRVQSRLTLRVRIRKTTQREMISMCKVQAELSNIQKLRVKGKETRDV